MKRQEILDAATQAVTKDRAATHGEAESSFAEIGKIWGIRLGVSISPEQVAIMLTDLKTVRAWHNPAHADNWVDMAGYAACGGEIATAEKQMSFLEVLQKSDELMKAGIEAIRGPKIPIGTLTTVTADAGETVEFHGKWGTYSFKNHGTEPRGYSFPPDTTHYRVVRI
jgi:hypothetical protein